jgi:hypothetical protein
MFNLCDGIMGGNLGVWMQNTLVYGQSNELQQLLTFIVGLVHLSICDQYGIHKLL